MSAARARGSAPGGVERDGVLAPLRWDGARGSLSLLDQTRLPSEELWVDCPDEDAVAGAIRNMLVRGAPAIGCTAAFGVAVAARRLVERGATGAELAQGIAAASERLAATRPTAVNLFWAIGEMRAAAEQALARTGDPAEVAAALAAALERRAVEIWDDDIARCRAIGAHGAALIPDPACVLTHCNAGALATGGYGTALGVIRGAIAQGKRVRVIADETRPFLQGARLTAWELAHDRIDVTVIPDVAAASILRGGEVSCVVVGADRIAANGDFANKIGTYPVALAAHAHGVPFYVAAPLSTIDLGTPDGASIPIEERDPIEVTHLAGFAGRSVVPPGVRARNPAFDVTPARLVSAIVTEEGVFRPPFEDFAARIRAAARRSSALTDRPPPPENS